MLETASSERVYESQANRALIGYGALGAGAAVVLLAAVGFVLALRTDASVVRLHLTTTLPMILASGLIFTGYAALRTPTRVSVADDALTVFRGQGMIGCWDWDAIALVVVEQAALGSGRVVKLFGNDGRRLVTLSDHLLGFDGMAEEIKQRVAARPSPSGAPVARKRGRKQGAFLLVAGIAFLALAGSVGYMAWADWQNAKLLRTQAAQGDGIIVRKFMAPDGRTTRIEYRIDQPGAPLENVRVDPTIWSFYQDGQRVPVMVVPGRTDISMLAIGQVDDGDFDPRLMLVLAPVLGLMALTFVVMGAVGLAGREMKWDAVTMRPRLARLGTELHS